MAWKGYERMTTTTKTAVVRSALERFERVAKAQRLPNHAELEALGEIASDLRDLAEELTETAEAFAGHVETLIDEENDRDDRRDARDSLSEEAETIYEKLDAISAYTVKPDVIRL